MAVNYRKTLISCYLGFITQAIAANFAPLLFLTFHNGYGIPVSYTHLRAHETGRNLVCRLLLEKKKK